MRPELIEYLACSLDGAGLPYGGPRPDFTSSSRSSLSLGVTLEVLGRCSKLILEEPDSLRFFKFVRKVG